LAVTPTVSLAKEQRATNSAVLLPVGEGSTGLAWSALMHPAQVTDEHVVRLLSHGSAGPPVIPPVLLLYALFQLRDGAQRRAISQYFQSLATPESDIMSDPSKMTFKLPSTLVTAPQAVHIQRAIALRALALSDDPADLAQVVSAALSDNSLPGWDPSPAREALLDLPDLRAKLAPLAPLLDPDQVARWLQPAPQRLAFSPLALANAAQQNPAALGSTLSRVIRQLDAARAQTPRTDKETFPRELVQPDAWERALTAQPLWTLRLAALLSSRLPAPVLRKVASHAESLVSLQARSGKQAPSVDGLLSRAASWSLPIINAALGRSSPLTSKHQSPATPEAMLDSWSIERWPAISTRSLWSLYERQGRPSVVAALCSRFQQGRRGDPLDTEWGPSVPSFHQLRLWITSNDPLVRGACAFGLSLSDETSSNSLLIARYFEEDSPLVRSAITRTLRLSLSPHHPLLKSIATLDPNQDVRLEAARPHPPEPFVLSLAPGPVTVLTKTGQSYRLVPEADGFSAHVEPAK
jgi:hypothetical protein